MKQTLQEDEAALYGNRLHTRQVICAIWREVHRSAHRRNFCVSTAQVTGSAFSKAQSRTPALQADHHRSYACARARPDTACRASTAWCFQKIICNMPTVCRRWLPEFSTAALWLPSGSLLVSEQTTLQTGKPRFVHCTCHHVMHTQMVNAAALVRQLGAGPSRCDVQSSLLQSASYLGLLLLEEG